MLPAKVVEPLKETKNIDTYEINYVLSISDSNCMP